MEPLQGLLQLSLSPQLPWSVPRLFLSVILPVVLPVAQSVRLAVCQPVLFVCLSSCLSWLASVSLPACLSGDLSAGLSVTVFWSGQVWSGLVWSGLAWFVRLCYISCLPVYSSVLTVQFASLLACSKQCTSKPPHLRACGRSVYARAFREGFTVTLVSGRTVGIGAYLARLGRRSVLESPIINFLMYISFTLWFDITHDVMPSHVLSA